MNNAQPKNKPFRSNYIILYIAIAILFIPFFEVQIRFHRPDPGSTLGHIPGSCKTADRTGQEDRAGQDRTAVCYLTSQYLTSPHLTIDHANRIVLNQTISNHIELNCIESKHLLLRV
jgi:hypothetical protein